jgi:hypothetical protein
MSSRVLVLLIDIGPSIPLLCVIDAFFVALYWNEADHSGRAAEGMNCFRSLQRWDRGFESRSRLGCVYCVRLFCVCVLRVDTGLATA